WFTYPAIRFLDKRVPPSASVYEYGCGHSTFWWMRRVAKVRGVEHNSQWFAFISRNLDKNVDIQCVDSYCDYPESILRGCEKFDIVVIDGIRRVECIRVALEMLAPQGVVIWDNSDRHEDKEGY